MQNVRIFSWNENSVSAKSLAHSLKVKRILHQGSKFSGGKNYTVINWGAGSVPNSVLGSNVLNSPFVIRINSNKFEFFESMSRGTEQPRLPEWTTEPDVVLGWVREGKEVVGRKVLNSHSGEGIIFSSETDLEEFLECPLFTVYKKKKDEFRVHIFKGEVIDVQKKMLRTEDDNGEKIDSSKIDFRVRNLSNGFIFGRMDIAVPPDVVEQARMSFRKSNLDFGAFDVIWNESEGMAYVLEVNTAPGIQGTTLDRYTEAFRSVL